MSWGKCTLADIVTIKKGEYITKKDAVSGKYPVILGGKEPAYYINKYNHVGKAIVISRSGASAGYVSFWNEPIFITDGFLIEPKQNTTHKFLFYLLKSKQSELSGIQRGAAIPHVTPSLINSINVSLPDLHMQNRIASILSAYDDLIENNQKQIKLLEEAAQRLYKEWFVDLRFPGWENTKIVDGVPEGWEKTTFGHICTVKKHIINIQENIPSDTPYIGLEHMPRHDFCLSEWGYAQSVSSSKFFFKKGDILFGKIRPYFHKVGFAICNGICSTDAIVMSTEKQLWSLLLMTASSDEFVNHSYQTCKEGSKMPRADWRSMELYPVLIATHELMNSFNLIIESICSKIEKLALENNLLSESLDVLLQKIMSEKNGGLI